MCCAITLADSGQEELASLLDMPGKDGGKRLECATGTIVARGYASLSRCRLAAGVHGFRGMETAENVCRIGAGDYP